MASVVEDTIGLPLLLLKINLRDGVVVVGFLVVVVLLLLTAVVVVVDVVDGDGLLALPDTSSELLSAKPKTKHY